MLDAGIPNNKCIIVLLPEIVALTISRFFISLPLTRLHALDNNSWIVFNTNERISSAPLFLLA